MSDYLIIDSVTDDVARLELPDGSLIEIPASWLPTGAKEADLLTVATTRGEASASTELTVDADATAARLKELTELRERVPRAPAGDLEL